MGKASSSKKVARAAGTGGGRSNRSSTPWTYVGLVALIVVVGAALTYTSRHRDETLAAAATNSNATVAPTIGGTPWHEGLGVYVCGSFLPAIKVASDPEGLTTDANGIIDITPKVKAAAGRNASLGEFATSIGMTVSASELQVPGGKKYSNGDNCAGKASRVYVKQYPYAGSTVGTIETADPNSIRLADNALITIAFVPPADKSKIPPPPPYVVANLKKLNTPTTTTVPSTTTTTPSSATTTPGSAATTTPGSASTTTGSATSTTTGSASATTAPSAPTTTGSSTSTSS
jgi:hypothetical protein